MILKAKKYKPARVITNTGLSFILLLVILSYSCFGRAAENDTIFSATFQTVSQPSGGKRGAYPGAFNRHVTYNGNHYTYYISIPPSYTPNNPMPLLFTWHGAAGAGTAPSNAKAMRDFWRPTADANDFIVVAQAATGELGGGWVPDRDVAILNLILKDMYRYYNIEKNRVYGHGFSAGGHIMHALMLYNSQEFAAYTVSAGVLEAFAGTSTPFNAARKIPVYISVGAFDTSGPNLRNLSRSNHQVFINAGWVDNQNLWINEFSGGHQIDPQLPQKAWDKIGQFTNQD